MSSFLFYLLCCWCYNISQVYKDLLVCFLLSFIVSALILKSLIHFGLTPYMVWDRSLNSSFASTCPITIDWKWIFFLPSELSCYPKSGDHNYEGYFWIFNSVPLSLYLSLATLFWWLKPWVNCEWKVWVLQYCSFFRIGLAFLGGSLNFCLNFRVSLPISAKKSAEILILCWLCKLIWGVLLS